MATVRAVYKRVFQIKPYESQTVELMVEEIVDDPTPRAELAKQSGFLYRDLERVGRELMLRTLSEAEKTGR